MIVGEVREGDRRSDRMSREGGGKGHGCVVKCTPRH